LRHCYDEIMKTPIRTYIIRFIGKGTVVVPWWLRKELDIKKGTRALVFQEEDAIVLKPITPRYIRNLRGSLKGSGVLKALMDGRKRERELN
jgi:bifunctional DNA-binding transcriptional regulator/antitoxin component of YhaV-PrlF toxin-antitoxin module